MGVEISQEGILIVEVRYDSGLGQIDIRVSFERGLDLGFILNRQRQNLLVYACMEYV